MSSQGSPSPPVPHTPSTPTSVPASHPASRSASEQDSEPREPSVGNQRVPLNFANTKEFSEMCEPWLKEEQYLMFEGTEYHPGDVILWHPTGVTGELERKECWVGILVGWMFPDDAFARDVPEDEWDEEGPRSSFFGPIQRRTSAGRRDMPVRCRGKLKGWGPEWDPYIKGMNSTTRVFGARYECMKPFGLIDYVTKREAYDFGIVWDGLIVEHGGPPDGTPSAKFKNPIQQGYEEQWFFRLPKKLVAAMPFVERVEQRVEDGVYTLTHHPGEKYPSFEVVRHAPFKRDLRNRGVRKSV
ncbi:uncharacterized protein B0H18DRAFT_959753 [Fomitopsis serialis]|uniref:uncharacterized protein n=1 Tax=Fomitopsis serialis TaxID=139415 RepID=UPI0020087164|nr:uncharacterized protein B0H18DRAFT_959753 [Neoantrodia serialis]KAH9914584.1 hypothetical protein B0H18DRAFT_959753 [Neoantrodia serialis]